MLCVHVDMEARRGCQCPGTEVSVGWELPRCWGLNPGSLKEPSLRPIFPTGLNASGMNCGCDICLILSSVCPLCMSEPPVKL